MIKQPQALPYLFLTEVWERFGFYVIQTLLVLYLVQHVGFSDDRSYALTGAFTSLAYMMSWLGGFIADRVLGFRNSVYVGGCLLIMGYLIFLIPGLQSLYFALAVVVVGTGFFKPNISGLLGTLYEIDDHRREAGFTIFYIGIYLGIVLSTATAGFMQQSVGWYACFIMASLGLMIGLLTFRAGQKTLQQHGLPPIATSTDPILIKLLHRPSALLLLILSIIFILHIVIRYDTFSSILLIGAGSLLMLGLFLRVASLPIPVRNKAWALLILMVASVIFWAVYFQMMLSAELFTKRVVERHYFGLEIPPVLFLSFQALALIFFGLVLAPLWRSLAQKQRNPSIALKFSLALLIIGASFIMLYMGAILTPQNHLVNPLWVLGAYALVAIAELLLSAIGLSAVTELAPSQLVGTMMGVWFVSLGLGGKLAGIIATQSSIDSATMDLHLQIANYAHAFIYYAAYAIVTGIFFLLLTPWLKRMVSIERPRPESNRRPAP